MDPIPSLRSAPTVRGARRIVCFWAPRKTDHSTRPFGSSNIDGVKDDSLKEAALPIHMGVTEEYPVVAPADPHLEHSEIHAGGLTPRSRTVSAIPPSYSALFECYAMRNVRHELEAKRLISLALLLR